jgi:hypothetical protein
MSSLGKGSIVASWRQCITGGRYGMLCAFHLSLRETVMSMIKVIKV